MNWGVAFAVDGCDAVLAEGFLMLCRAVAHVVFKSVLWIFFCFLLHDAVARDFGDD